MSLEIMNDELPKNPTDSMVRDALANNENLSESQDIYKVFQTSLNEFIKKVGEFSGSKSQLQRVLINLAISPLNSEELHHSYAGEKELFELGTSVNSAKFFLMLQGLEQQGKIIVVENTKVESAPLTEQEKMDALVLEAEANNETMEKE